VRLSARGPADLQRFDTEVDQKKLRVKNGDMAITQLARSEDIHLDLINHLLLRDSQKFMNIIFTEFQNHKRQTEFLCIIFRHTLVAISQSHPDENFGIKKDADRIRKEISKFFDKIKNWIPYKNCVMLVHLDEDKEVFVKILDFFPLESSTPLGLYNWHADMHILCPENGVKVPDFRAK